MDQHDQHNQHNSVFTTIYKNNRRTLLRLDRDICNIIVLLNEQECYTTNSCQKIRSGPFSGSAWVQFDSPQSFQKLLKIAKDSKLLNWICNYKLGINSVQVLCKPLITAEMRIDVYFHPLDIPFFEHHLIALRKIKSKL